MSMYADLAGKVAVITGSGRRKGLGEAIAWRLGKEGCKIVLADIGAAKNEYLPEDAIGTSAEMEAIASEMREAGIEVKTAVCNVLEESDVEALAKTAKDTFGSLDIWVNNAGVGYLMTALVDTKAEEWDTVLGVNLRGVFLGIKHAGRIMQAQGSGRIINIGSQASKSAFAEAGAYTTSKHGVVGLTRVAAKELGPHGVNVNAVCPNHVTTGLGAWQNQRFAGGDMDKYMADMRARIPLGRPGLQEDTAKACAFLSSEQSVYVTGECMNVSGGEEYH
ncbi:SDR family NAD(P)-dependent oxidoreductase [Alteromonas lipolytica]|uniref:Oxidoreductase n=1 Tax=Alteromonas lipolytica TaxID=1856405 RepID=A0A1E8FCJ1_9ALTE|nr:SDR family NAD(P)-dependent oxidoreductase [Alteromonas lipolytica]OFI33328.1 oxidoreductase [Alteromonas lipolytica]GGF60666.1 beta-ketoacyl-ACP reductase [Alteromonas lipolytica]